MINKIAYWLGIWFYERGKNQQIISVSYSKQAFIHVVEDNPFADMTIYVIDNLGSKNKRSGFHMGIVKGHGFAIVDRNGEWWETVKHEYCEYRYHLEHKFYWLIKFRDYVLLWFIKHDSKPSEITVNKIKEELSK